MHLRADLPYFSVFILRSRFDQFVDELPSLSLLRIRSHFRCILADYSHFCIKFTASFSICRRFALFLSYPDDGVIIDFFRRFSLTFMHLNYSVVFDTFVADIPSVLHIKFTTSFLIHMQTSYPNVFQFNLRRQFGFNNR